MIASKQPAIWYNAVTMPNQTPFITTSQSQPLIGIPFEENGKEVVRYYSEEAQADQAVSTDITEEPLSLADAWSDLSWDEMEKALDRIRHESKPTSPIEHL